MKESSWLWQLTPLIPILGRHRQTVLSEFKVWWHTTLIPSLGRQRQADLHEFKDSLVYRVSSRTKIHRETLYQKAKN